jgi:hypothetical protein
MHTQDDCEMNTKFSTGTKRSRTTTLLGYSEFWKQEIKRNTVKFVAVTIALMQDAEELN